MTSQNEMYDEVSGGVTPDINGRTLEVDKVIPPITLQTSMQANVHETPLTLFTLSQPRNSSRLKHSLDQSPLQTGRRNYPLSHRYKTKLNPSQIIKNKGMDRSEIVSYIEGLKLFPD